MIRRELCAAGLYPGGIRNSSWKRLDCGRGRGPQDKTGECPLWWGKATATILGRVSMALGRLHRD